MIDEIFRRHLINEINEYSAKLTSGEITKPEDAEKCHWAKLALYKYKDKEKRYISLKTIADCKNKAIIPYVLQEINMQTRKKINKKTADLVKNLYSILHIKGFNHLD